MARAPLFFGSLAGTATAVILTGPTFGSVGTASTYTVSLNQPSYPGTLTVTPAADNSGGVSPPSFGLTSAAPSHTFTVTPSVIGVTNVSITNNGGLINQGSPIALVAGGAFQPHMPGNVSFQPFLAQ